MTSRLTFACSVLLLLVACAGQRTVTELELNDAARIWTTEDGRQYRVERLEKRSGAYQLTEQGRLRWFPNGLYEIERETDASFYVRQYLPVAPRIADADAEPTALSPPVAASLEVQHLDVGLPREGQWRDRFALADLNADGRLDLALPPARKSYNMAPIIYLGQADGSWKRWDERQFPAMRFDYGAVASADFNRDGHADLAVGMHIQGISAFHGNGQGQFTAHANGLPVPLAGQPPQLSSRNLVLQDWDQDGATDLIVLNEWLGQDPKSPYRDGLVIFQNQGERWQALPSAPSLKEARLLAQDRSGRVLIFSPGTLIDGELRLSEQAAGKLQTHAIADLPANARITALAVVGKDQRATQVALAYQARSAKSWWLHLDLLVRAGRTWQRHSLLRVPESREIRDLQFLNPNTPAQQLAAVDGNGQIELWAATRAAAVWQRLKPLPAPEWRLGCAGYMLQGVDLDADGHDELVANFAGERRILQPGADCDRGGGVEVLKLSVTAAGQ